MAKRKMNPNSLANLIPNSQRSPEELSRMGKKGNKVKKVLNSIKWSCEICWIYESEFGTWGHFKVLEARPNQVKEIIEEVFKRVNHYAHMELEKEWAKMYKEYTGHKWKPT